MRPLTHYWPREKRRPKPPPVVWNDCGASLAVGDVLIVNDRLRYQVVQVMREPVRYVLANLNPNKPERLYELVPYRGLQRIY